MRKFEGGKRAANRIFDIRPRVGGISSPSATPPLRLPCNRKQTMLPVQEDHQAQFYEDYRKVADEYEKEFLKKYGEDLNATLIFASLMTILANVR